MGVRNCAEIGENLIRICRQLLANNDLVKLLYYTDKDPLSHPNLTEEEKEKFVFEKLIKITPFLREDDAAAKSAVIILVNEGIRDPNNNEFRNISITLESYVPFDQWKIKSTNLRPYLIMGEIQKSLEGKTVNGLGKIIYGDFNLKFLTKETSCHAQEFEITTYD